MLKNEEIEKDIPKGTGWLNFKEAIEEAKNMVSTVVVTVIFTISRINTYVIEIQGIDQMVSVVKGLDKLKTQKKIKNYIINNLSAFPPIDIQIFKKLVKEKL
jgi:hypothetical protein